MENSKGHHYAKHQDISPNAFTPYILVSESSRKYDKVKPWMKKCFIYVDKR